MRLDNDLYNLFLSLFVRRMWIEISNDSRDVCISGSLFVRRMWIEITAASTKDIAELVTLRTKNVDWNVVSLEVAKRLMCHSSYEECGLKWWASLLFRGRQCHSSYEECGLKCNCPPSVRAFGWSLFVRRMWIEIIERDAAVGIYCVTLRTKNVDWNA